MILFGVGTAIILVALLIQVNILQNRLRGYEHKMLSLAENLLTSQEVINNLIIAHNSLIEDINQAKDEMMEMDNIDNILPLDLTNSMGLA
jgi:hypothetical protein